MMGDKLRRFYVVCLVIALLNLLDAITTYAGVNFCGAEELNPLMSKVISQSWLNFVLIKILGSLYFHPLIPLFVLVKRDKLNYKTIKLCLICLFSIAFFYSLIVINNLTVIITRGWLK